MSIAGLMIHRVHVLEFALDAAPNMDAHRVYRRRTRVEDGETVIDSVRCRISQLGANELIAHSMRNAETTHRVYFDANPNLREENRIEYKGVQYILLGIPTNASQADRLWTLDVKMVTFQNENAKVIE